jgi:hypothetical protein
MSVNTPPRKFETDFNDRERARIAEQLRELGKLANDSADALVSRNDADFIVAFLMLGITGGKRISDIMKEVSSAMKKSDENEFPSVIGG